MDESRYSCVQDRITKVWIVTPKVLNEVVEPEGGGINMLMFRHQREDVVGSSSYSDF